MLDQLNYLNSIPPVPSPSPGDKTAAVQRIDSGKERLRGGVIVTLCAALIHLLEVR